MEQDHTFQAGADEAKPRIAAAERWRAIIEQQRQSGLGVSAFCRQRSIPTSSFFCWRRKLSRPAGADGAGFGRAGSGRAGQFAAVKVIGQARRAGAAIEVRLRGGRRLLLRSGFDPDLLRRAVAALEGPA